MHILQGALILALFCSAPAHSAGDARIKGLAGLWKGSVTTSPDGCDWGVTANVLEKQGYLTGNFNYSGPCAKGLNAGTFNAAPSGQGCFSIAAFIPGLPRIQLSACFDEAGVLVFNSMFLSGTLKVLDEGRRADLGAKSLLGGASGSFRKQFKGQPAKDGKKGKSNVQPVKSRPLEVHGGSN